MKFIFGFIFALIVIIIAVPLLFFNFFVSGNPRDLGVTYTPADYSSTHQKIGTEVGSLPATVSVKESLQTSGQKEIKISLNSSEITAYLNADKYIYTPISNVQVKINPDGTGEASGRLDIQKFITYVSLTTPTTEIQKVIDQFHISANPTFYAKGTVSVINNLVDFNIQQLQISRIPVPQNYIMNNTGALNDYATKKLNSIPNLQVHSLTLSESQANLDATVPEKVLKVEK